MSTPTSMVSNTGSRGLMSRETPNNTTSLREFIVVYECIKTGKTLQATKHARTVRHAETIVSELLGGYCNIIETYRK